MPRFKQMPMHPCQVILFSQSVEDALPADNNVRGFSDVMECLDYSKIEDKCSERGCPPYPPRVMAKILGYAYSEGLRSSRKIEKLLTVDVRFIWLAGGLKPDHNTIARFRKENWQELVGLFKDSVRVSNEAGLVFLKVVATDGSKIAAAASKRRTYSESRLDREMGAVEKILEEADEVDLAEDEAYGTLTGNELPEHLKDAKARKARLEEIAERLKKSKRSAAVETDPDSRVMCDKGEKRPCYNMQTSVDAASQVIVAMKLTNRENDHGLLPEMMEEVKSNTGKLPELSLADCGYGDEQTLEWLEENEHEALMPLQEHPRESGRNDLFASKSFLADEERDVLICPAGRELTFRGERRCGSGTYRRYDAKGCRSCSFRRECVGRNRGSRRVNVSVVAAQRKMMLERFASPEGKKLYALRQETVEPVFGQMKSNTGFDRFGLWGLDGATAEAALICLAHNVRKCAAKAAKGTFLAAVVFIAVLLGFVNGRRGHRQAATSHLVTSAVAAF